MKSTNQEIRWRIARLARRRRLLTMAVLNGELSREEADLLQPTDLLRLQALAAATPCKRTIYNTLSALALVALQTAPAFAGGSGLEVETALNPFVIFFVSFVMPVIGIAALVGAGVAFISGGARAVGNVAVILLGVAFVGFAVPIAASRFGLTQGALLW
jgi:hypothetical protein